MVYKDAGALYEEVMQECHAYLSGTSGEPCLINSLSWPRIVHLGENSYRLPPMSVSRLPDVLFLSSDTPTIYQEKNGIIVMKNQYLEAWLDLHGRLISLRIISEGGIFEAVAPGEVCNEFCLYDDVPLYWDAWDVMDYHLESRRAEDRLISPLKLLSSGQLEVVAEFEMKIGEKSRLKQRIVLGTEKPYLEFRTDVEWRESHKFLKVDFPLNVHAEYATYEIQFGHLSRPTHRYCTSKQTRANVRKYG